MSGPYIPNETSDPLWPALTGHPSKKGKNNNLTKGVNKGKKNFNVPIPNLPPLPHPDAHPPILDQNQTSNNGEAANNNPTIAEQTTGTNPGQNNAIVNNNVNANTNQIPPQN